MHSSFLPRRQGRPGPRDALGRQLVCFPIPQDLKAQPVRAPDWLVFKDTDIMSRLLIGWNCSKRHSAEAPGTNQIQPPKPRANGAWLHLLVFPSSPPQTILPPPRKRTKVPFGPAAPWPHLQAPLQSPSCPAWDSGDQLGCCWGWSPSNSQLPEQRQEQHRDGDEQCPALRGASRSCSQLGDKEGSVWVAEQLLGEDG